MRKNTETVVRLAKEKSTKREREVIDAVKAMQADGDTVTFYSVAKRTGASKSYLYSNESIRKAIEDARSGEVSKYTSSKVIIDGLKRENRALLAENERLRSLDAAKLEAEVAELKQKVKDLEKQLRSAYSYNDIFNPFREGER